MPQDLNHNINSKEKNLSPDRSDSDIDDLIQASEQLRLSLSNFGTTLQRVSENSSAKNSVPGSTYRNPKSTKDNSKSSKASFVGSKADFPLKSKFGFTVGDTVQVLNVIKADGYIIPEEYKFGVVTRFNKRFVYFDIRYSKNGNWLSYEAYREPKNLKLINSSK